MEFIPTQYEIKSSLGKNLRYSLKEIQFELLCLFSFSATFEEIYDAINIDDKIFLLSFEDIANKIESLR